MMARQTINTSRKIVFSAWILAGLCLLMLPNQLTDPCQSLFRRTFQPALRFGSRISSLSAARSVQEIEDPVLRDRIAELEAENKQQVTTISNQNESIARLKLQIHELSNLRQDLGLDRLQLVLADVVLSLTSEHLVLNRGTHDRLEAGLFAICGNAIVGRITLAEKNHESHLMLVTHPKSTIPAYITHTRAKGDRPPCIIGKLDGLSNGVMRMVVNSREDIRAGDPVHALVQYHLSVPFQIGKVATDRTYREAPTLTEVLVEPVAPLHALRELHVLLPKE